MLLFSNCAFTSNSIGTRIVFYTISEDVSVNATRKGFYHSTIKATIIIRGYKTTVRHICIYFVGTPIKTHNLNVCVIDFGNRKYIIFYRFHFCPSQIVIKCGN